MQLRRQRDVTAGEQLPSRQVATHSSNHIVMARALIRSAIESGAPLYNAGQVAMCARIYEDAARKLLLDQRTELREPVAKSLTDALAVAGALGSVPGPSEADQLAWAFRRAFDEQLAASAVPKAGAASEGPAAIIAAAIQKGVPLYNSGNPEGCAQVYAEAAQRLLDGGSMGSGARATLQRALDSLPQLPNADARAWALRRSLDAVAANNGPQMPQTSASESTPPPALVRDFSAGRGLEVAGFIVNDTVMGGRSDSELQMSEGAVFRGNVTKRGGGGFASVRFQPRDRAAFLAMLRGATGLSLKVRRMQGCASWKLQLNSQQEKQWQQDFLIRDAQGPQDIRVPLSAMWPTWRGRVVGGCGLSGRDLEDIQGFGFMLSFLAADGSSNSAFQEGPFELHILSISTY